MLLMVVERLSTIYEVLSSNGFFFLVFVKTHKPECGGKNDIVHIRKAINKIMLYMYV